MKVIDPGHDYQLDALDGNNIQRLTFVKREGSRYPGNVGSYSGTTMQEVLRVLIERANYVNCQIPCAETTCVVQLLESALYLLEVRAARCHGRILTASLHDVIDGEGKCVKCGHVGCEGHDE